MTIFHTNETFYQAMTTDPLSISIYQWKAILQQHRDEFLKFSAEVIKNLLTNKVSNNWFMSNHDKEAFENFGIFLFNYCSEEELRFAKNLIGRDALFCSNPFALQQMHKKDSSWYDIFYFLRHTKYVDPNLTFEEFKKNEEEKSLND